MERVLSANGSGLEEGTVSKRSELERVREQTIGIQARTLWWSV